MIALEMGQFLWNVTRQNQKQNNKITIIFGSKTFSDYSLTSHKRPPKMQTLRIVVTNGRWSPTRIKPQGAFTKKRSGHIYFMEDNLLHAISKLHHL